LNIGSGKEREKKSKKTRIEGPKEKRSEKKRKRAHRLQEVSGEKKRHPGDFFQNLKRGVQVWGRESLAGIPAVENSRAQGKGNSELGKKNKKRKKNAEEGLRKKRNLVFDERL